MQEVQIYNPYPEHHLDIQPKKGIRQLKLKKKTLIQHTGRHIYPQLPSFHIIFQGGEICQIICLLPVFYMDGGNVKNGAGLFPAGATIPINIIDT